MILVGKILNTNQKVDITYTDYDEMIGAATGDEIRIENSRYAAKYDAWTGHQYRGYNPINA